MLKLKTLFSFALLLTCFVQANSRGGHRGHGCLTDAEAYDIIQKWLSFFQEGFDPAVAEDLLADDFTSQSGGINFLTAKDATAITVSSKAQFIAEAEINTANTTNIFTVTDWFHGCDSIAFHWSLNSALAVTLGIDYLILQKGTHLIRKDYSEFNIGAVLFNAGFPECQGPA